MNRKLFICMALLGLAACSAREDEDGDLDFDATDWSTQLSSRAGTTVTGSATSRSVGIEGGSGTATANIEVRGATAGARHPWHVHSGTCATGGPIVGEADDYPVLEIEADGTDEATAAIEAGMSDERSYHVNVHRSPSDLGTIIACGDLRD